MGFRFLAIPHAFALVVLATPPTSAARASDDYAYEIKERLSIKDLSVLLYGNEDRWNEIADWNRLKPPYRLEVGTKLRLEDQPIPELEGRRLIVERWRSSLSRSSAYQKPMSSREFLPKFRAQEGQAQSTSKRDQARQVAWQLVALGKAALAGGDFAGAADLLKRARIVDTTNLQAWLTEIRAHRQAGQVAEARKIADDLVNTHPDAVDFALVREARGRG